MESGEIIFAFLIIIGVSALIGAIALNMPLAKQPYEESNIPYKNPLTSLAITYFKANETYEYQHQIKNPNATVTIRIFHFLSTEPSELKQYITFTSSILNATEIQPLRSIITTYTFQIHQNASKIENGEIYVDVGCLKQGEDY